MTALISTSLLLLLLTSHSLLANITAELYISIKTGLNQPTDTAISSNGDIYVLNGTLGQVIVFSAQGKKKFIFSRPGKGNAQLNLPMGISINNNRVYIADTGNQRISIFDLQGKLVRNIALESDQPVAPVSLLINNKKIIWSDRENHRLCIHHLNTGKLLNCWGEKGEMDGQFRFPFQLAADDQGYIHAVDVLNARVQIFSPRGKHFMNVGRFGVNPAGINAGKLFRPNGLALNDDERVFISDAYLGSISIFYQGKALGLLTDRNGIELKFKSPTGLSLWKNKLYITDTLNNSVEIFILTKSGINKPRLKPATIAVTGHSQKNCIGCHIAWSDNYTAQNKHPGIAPVAQQKMCYSCHHGVIIDSRISIGQKEQHPDIHNPREKKKIAKKNKDKIAEGFPLADTPLTNNLNTNKTDNNNKKLYCGSCHTPHRLQDRQTDSPSEDYNNSWLRQENNSGEICQQCHQSRLDHVQHKKRPSRGVNHPIGIYLKQPLKNNTHFAKDKNLHLGLPEKLISAGASLNDQQQIICQSCHLVHGSDEEKLTAKTDTKLCQQCHQRHYVKDLHEARIKGVHPVNVKLEKPVTINNKKIKIVDCLSCHSPHNGKPNTPLLAAGYKNGELCNICHEDYNKIINSDHDLRLSAAKSKNRYQQTPEQAGACGSCHSMHQAEKNIFSLDATELHSYKGEEKPLPRDQACLNCHRKEGVADKSPVKFFSHPSKDMILRSAKNKMPLLDKDDKINEFGAIACITCHNPHRWSTHKNIERNLSHKTKADKNDNGNILNSFLRGKNISDSFCKDCHGIETRIKYKYYHLDSSRAQKKTSDLQNINN
jgi:predicted CXXCH cytochrome family protein